MLGMLAAQESYTLHHQFPPCHVIKSETEYTCAKNRQNMKSVSCCPRMGSWVGVPPDLSPPQQYLHITGTPVTYLKAMQAWTKEDISIWAKKSTNRGDNLQWTKDASLDNRAGIFQVNLWSQERGKTKYNPHTERGRTWLLIRVKSGTGQKGEGWKSFQTKLKFPKPSNWFSTSQVYPWHHSHKE